MSDHGVTNPTELARYWRQRAETAEEWIGNVNEAMGEDRNTAAFVDDAVAKLKARCEQAELVRDRAVEALRLISSATVQGGDLRTLTFPNVEAYRIVTQINEAARAVLDGAASTVGSDEQ